MKLLLKKVLSIYPYSFSQKFKNWRNVIYTHWLSNSIKTIGNSVLFIYPTTMIKGGEYISIGNGTGFGSHLILTAWDKYEGDVFIPSISIGNNVWIGENCHITASNKISIGNGVLMGKGITISDNSHGVTDFESLQIPPIKRPLYSKGAVIIEDGVWIGDKATILAGVSIGKNSVIGANSVVTESIPANSVAVGIPARIIKQL